VDCGCCGRLNAAESPLRRWAGVAASRVLAAGNSDAVDWTGEVVPEKRTPSGRSGGVRAAEDLDVHGWCSMAECGPLADSLADCRWRSSTVSTVGPFQPVLVEGNTPAQIQWMRLWNGHRSIAASRNRDDRREIESCPFSLLDGQAVGDHCCTLSRDYSGTS
jgi:hypothetical protein